MTDYLSVADTARLVRRALADAFPGVRFSVRSSSYSGGASIRVRYTDGPPVDDVRKVTGPYVGRDFDGMIDLAFGVTAIVDAAGRIVGHRSSGSVGSRGVIAPIDDPIPAGARLVHFGADHIFVDQDLSPDVSARRDRWLRTYGYDPDAPWTISRTAYDQAVWYALATAS